MTNKLFTIIFAITFTVMPTYQKGNSLQQHMELLFTNMNDQEVLKEFKDFAQEIFQIESSQEDLYEFMLEFLTKDLEEVSEIGQLDEEQQKQKISQEIQEVLKKHFDDKIANQEFDLIKDGFQDAFKKVQDIYERQFLAILGRKIKLGDKDLRLPFDFVSQLFNQIKDLKDNESFSNHYQKQKVAKINEYIKFINENQKNFQNQYKDYLQTYAKYAIIVTDNYSELIYSIDEFITNASQQMNEDNREDMLRRINGLVGLFIRLNDSGDAVAEEFRQKKDQEDEVDNRSEDEKKRDLKDYILLRLQTMRIENMDSEDDVEDVYVNLSYITGTVVDAFIKYDKNVHIFHYMRSIFIQNIAISSSKSVQSVILQKMYQNFDEDLESIKEEADQLQDDEVQPYVLFLADVLCLDIFQEEEQTKDQVPEAFRILYQKLLAIPSKILQGNGALQLLGHYAIAPEGQEMNYYTEYYQLITKFRLQNNFNLQLLGDHFQTAIAMQFFVNQQYNFEQQHEKDSFLVGNYFKFKTTTILHMLAFVNLEDYTTDEEKDQLRQMYQVNYEQASDEELNELLSGNYIVYRPSNVKTPLQKILQIFSEHWEEEEDVQNDEFEFTKEGMNMFSENTFNLLDILGDGMKDHITVTITQNEGVTRSLPLGLQSNFKIGFYGVDALHYQEAEKNKNLTAQEKEKKRQNDNSEDSIDAHVLTSNEQRNPNQSSPKRQTNTNLQKQVVLDSGNSQSQQSRSQSNSQESNQVLNQEGPNDISEEDTLPESDKIKNKKPESFSFDQPVDQDMTQNPQQKTQNDLLNRQKQNEAFSFGEGQNNELSSNEDSQEKQIIAQGNPFNKVNSETSSEEDTVHQNQQTNDPTKRLQFESSSSEDSTVHQNRQDNTKSQKVQLDTSSEEDELVNNQSQDSQSRGSQERSIGDNSVESNHQKQVRVEQSESNEERSQPQNSQEDMLQLNRIDGDKVKSPQNNVTFISGQPLNQKEEEYLQDPNLMQKLKQNKDQNNQVTFENDDGSITEIVYVQIIPYGSDCYKSYQEALMNY